MTFALVLDSMPPPPSGNVLLRMHWAKRRRAASAWQAAVMAAVCKARADHAARVGSLPWRTWPSLGPWRYTRRRRRAVTFVRVSPRPLDADNLAMSFKAICDALVQQRILVDDSPYWAAVNYSQRKPHSGERPHVRIEVSETDVAEPAPQRTRARV